MKLQNSILLKLVSAAVIFMFACNSNNDPSKAAERFLNAFNERKYDEARKYATPETIKLVDLMENLSKMSEAADSVTHPKIEVTNQKVEGDTAYVTFREEGSEETEEIKVVKTDGKWLVHITKTDLSAKDNSVFDTGSQDDPGLDSGEAGEVMVDSLETSDGNDSTQVSK